MTTETKRGPWHDWEPRDAAVIRWRSPRSGQLHTGVIDGGEVHITNAGDADGYLLLEELRENLDHYAEPDSWEVLA